ncbi:hypothetical protein [Salipiger bermudensis]|nr:hypothetical protein [Salipiger bermudensis]MCA1288640.1 hypothetical protein [Salipiger bermudensis]
MPTVDADEIKQFTVGQLVALVRRLFLCRSPEDRNRPIEAACLTKAG